MFNKASVKVICSTTEQGWFFFQLVTANNIPKWCIYNIHPKILNTFFFLKFHCFFLSPTMEDMLSPHEWPNPCPAELIKMPHPLLIFSQSDYLIQIIALNSHT